MRALHVHLNERRVGTLSEGDDLWSFAYDPAWADATDGFDLSPALPRRQPLHQDGGTRRSVQWYFDNLLPEEQLRDAISREADIRGDDAFALLEYLGAESAGSLVLLPPGKPVGEPGGVQLLPDATLCQRIRNLPRHTLGQGAPKRMSAAGAQHKLLVVFRDGQLHEPVGNEASTHLLKPNHPGSDYPASVINEYLVMLLAQRLKLEVPNVLRRYTPEPVYLVERCDRRIDSADRTQRLHIVDACQLLDKSRAFKYQAASLQTLGELVMRCRNRPSTRLRLFEWLVFNLLVGNNDNHLKNLSFRVSAEGIELAPAYDLLSTASYDTTAMAADERAIWPRAPLAIALPGANTFAEVSRKAVLRAGEALGLPQRIAQRELDRLVRALPTALAGLIAAIEAENAYAPDDVKPHLAGEVRLMRTIQHVVVRDMLARVTGP